MVVSGNVLHAQNGAYNGFTPYSMYGVGDLQTPGSAYNKSMGGVGIASRNNRFMNLMNPAAVTARDSLSFMADFGVMANTQLFKSDGVSSANNLFNISNLAISFPVYKSSAMYVGISPYSNVGYSFSAPETDQAIIGRTGNITYTSSGEGSIYQVFLGGGATFWKKFSVGVEGIYYFGTLHKTSAVTFSNTSYAGISSGYDMTLRAGTAKFGLQYETPVGEDYTLGVGATYKLGANLGGYVTDYKYKSSSSVTDTLRYNSDTLRHASQRVRLASEIGVGVSLKFRDRWVAEIDYTRSDWSKSNFATTAGFANSSEKAVFSSTCSQSVRGGFEITPNRNDIRYFYKRITYRAGAYYDKSYYLLNNHPVTSMGLTFGATIPVNRWYNGVTFSVDMGQRGKLTDYMVRERYVNFCVSFNIFDIWFQKPRYE